MLLLQIGRSDFIFQGQFKIHREILKKDRSDVKFPLLDFNIGKILVYKVYDKLSLGLVLESNQEIEVLDRIKREI